MLLCVYPAAKPGENLEKTFLPLYIHHLSCLKVPLINKLINHLIN